MYLITILSQVFPQFGSGFHRITCVCSTYLYWQSFISKLSCQVYHMEATEDTDIITKDQATVDTVQVAAPKDLVPETHINKTLAQASPFLMVRMPAGFGPSQSIPYGYGPGQSGPQGYGPGQSIPFGYGPGQFGPGNSGPGQFGPGQSGPGNFGPGNSGPGGFSQGSFPGQGGHGGYKEHGY
ncbi:uncharacterized protein LOC142980106 [Anticarsia gemmatalis]|uniref:uncharacterized protein LOC142980106 n=1 Tax=Anticarsia gemmatalis TaxID=129554 RepID=UPI003F767CEB